MALYSLCCSQALERKLTDEVVGPGGVRRSPHRLVVDGEVVYFWLCSISRNCPSRKRDELVSGTERGRSPSMCSEAWRKRVSRTSVLRLTLECGPS